MAPGTRTPNERLNSESCAGLPRDLNARLPAKSDTRLKVVFWRGRTPFYRLCTTPMTTEAKAFNARRSRQIAVRNERKFGLPGAACYVLSCPISCFVIQSKSSSSFLVVMQNIPRDLSLPCICSIASSGISSFGTKKTRVLSGYTATKAM